MLNILVLMLQDCIIDIHLDVKTVSSNKTLMEASVKSSLFKNKTDTVVVVIVVITTQFWNICMLKNKSLYRGLSADYGPIKWHLLHKPSTKECECTKYIWIITNNKKKQQGLRKVLIIISCSLLLLSSSSLLLLLLLLYCYYYCIIIIIIHKKFLP